MFFVMLFLPLYSALWSGLGGRWLGRVGTPWVVVGLIGMSALGAWWNLVTWSLHETTLHIQGGTWLQMEGFHCAWGWLYDSLTAVMVVVITTISFCVHLYTVAYMEGDPHVPRFLAYLSLFTFLMLWLVTAHNLLQAFIGWEGVGFCSYLLINFWTTRIQANKAALKAMWVNRVGDMFFLFSLFGLVALGQTLHYETLWTVLPYYLDHGWTLGPWSGSTLSLLSGCLALGAMGKSAQIFFHIWLPDAMEGPTPVSALLHAATMVTAGVFVVARCSPLFELCEGPLFLLTLAGALTAWMAGTLGVVQQDLKRIIAYSTCSQLGYMFFICGLSHYMLGIFHLSNHAFFKALLFLSAGVVIHALPDEQDIRKYGGLQRLLPFTYSVFVIGSLALAGFPFLSGFYSKDYLLEIAYAKYSLWGQWAYALGVSAALCTAFYSTRLLALTFWGRPRSSRKQLLQASDASFQLGFPLGFLALGSLFLGYVSADLFIGPGTPFWGNALYMTPEHGVGFQAEALSVLWKQLPLFGSLFGMVFAWWFYQPQPTFPGVRFWTKGWHALYLFLGHKWFFDKLYAWGLYQPFLAVGDQLTYRQWDRGWLEALGPRGLVHQLTFPTIFVQQSAPGSLYHMLFCMLGGILGLGGFLFWGGISAGKSFLLLALLWFGSSGL